MRLLKRPKSKNTAAAQLRGNTTHPFGALDGYASLGGDVRVYRAVREAIPVIDAAVVKIIRLCGGFTVTCGGGRAEAELQRFVNTVPVGRGQRGLENFVDQYLDSMLTCGRAVGEIVTAGDRDIAAVLCGNVCDVQIHEGDSPLEFKLCVYENGGTLKELPYQNLLLFTPFHPETDAPYGVSMLRGMPFLAEILMKIYNCIGLNWERAGNVRYAVVYKPQGELLDKAFAQDRAEQIAAEWANAMQETKNGSVRDFVAVGDVDIKVIGADGPIPDSEVPLRQILEQLISKTGIPPFMLGMNWSSTERMSTQQADMMTSELTAIRRVLTPVLEQICGLWLRMHGYAVLPEIQWEPINLQDDVEEAKARLYTAQAKQLEQEGEDGI